jgi:Cysteine rich repeat
MKKTVYVSSVVVSLVLLAAGSPPASAQSGPTPQERMACRSDAQTFCAEHIGKPPQMNACLRENKEKLSAACRQVVDSHGG